MSRVVNAFKRAREMMAAIQAVIVAAGADLSARSEGFAKIGGYRSRGHGEGLAHNKHSSRSVAQDKRDSTKHRNVVRNRRAHA